MPLVSTKVRRRVWNARLIDKPEAGEAFMMKADILRMIRPEAGVRVTSVKTTFEEAEEAEPSKPDGEVTTARRLGVWEDMTREEVVLASERFGWWGDSYEWMK